MMSGTWCSFCFVDCEGGEYKNAGSTSLRLLYLDSELWQDNNDVYTITQSASLMLEAQFCADFYRCVLPDCCRLWRACRDAVTCLEV